VPALRRKLFSGTAYTLAGAIAAHAISLVLSVVYARLLGTDLLGKLAVITQLASTIVPLSNLGMGTVVARMIPEYQRKGKDATAKLLSSAYVVIFATGAVVSLTYFVLAGYLASFLGIPELWPLIQISASIVVLDALLNLSAAVVQGFQRVRELAVLGLLSKAVTVPVVFVLVLTFGLLGAVLASVVAILLNIAIYFRAILGILRRDRLRPSLRGFDRATATAVLAGALPLFASFIVLRPALFFQTSFLALTVGYQAAGFSLIAQGLYRIALLMPNALSIPLLPAISEMYVEDTRERTRGKLSALIRVTAMVSLPVSLAIGLGSIVIIQILYGSQYAAAAPLAFVMSAAAFVDSLGVVIESTLLGTGRMKLVFLLTGMQASVVAIGSFLFIGWFGLIGIGFAMLANAILYAAVVGVYFLRRGELNFHEFRGILAFSLAAFGGAALLVVLGSLSNLPISIAFLVSLLVVEVFMLSPRDRFVLRDAVKGELRDFARAIRRLLHI